LLPPPPIPPLFPYTTLFRSQRELSFSQRGVGGEQSRRPPLGERVVQAAGRARHRQLADLERTLDAVEVRRRETTFRDHLPPDLVDRKSTRLNSSHQIISYAV